MVPDRLEKWTLKDVERLVSQGIYESDLFDLKEMLPPPADDRGKQRLRKTCAAFANSDGGFIIFGVSDDRRIVGIDATEDFPSQFGNFPSRCSPSVYWQSKALPLSAGSGRVVHVVHTPRSWRAPHAVEDGDGWVFPKRTNKGTEPMSYPEVQSMFLGYYEKRLKLQLLRAELIQLAQLSDRITLSSDEDEISTSYLPTLELRVLESVLADTYSITHAYPALLGALAQLRPAVQHLNSRTEILRLGIAVYPAAGRHRMLTHNTVLETLKREVARLAGDAIRELDKIIT